MTENTKKKVESVQTQSVLCPDPGAVSVQIIAFLGPVRTHGT